MPHVSIRRTSVLSILLITQERSQYNIAMALKLVLLLGVIQLFLFTGATKDIRKTRDKMKAEGWRY